MMHWEEQKVLLGQETICPEDVSTSNNEDSKYNDLGLPSMPRATSPLKDY